MTDEITNTDKLAGLPWSIASGSANSVSAQWTFFGTPFVLLLSELGANNGRIGFLLSLFPFAGLLALVIARAAAAFGNKRTYLTFWSIRYLFAAGLLLIPWLQSRMSPGGLAGYVAVLVLCFAICRSVAETGYYPWAQEFIPNAVRGKYYAAFYGFSTLASFAAVLIASYIVGQGTGVGRYMGLIAAGVLFGLLTVWLANFVPGGAPQRGSAASKAAAGQSMVGSLRDKHFRGYLGAAALVVLGSAPLASFQPLLLRDRIGLGDGLVVLVQAAVLIGGFVSGFLWGWLADRYGSKPVIMSVVLLNALVALGWIIVPNSSVATLPLAFAVAGLAGAAAQVLELVVVRLEIVVRDAPVLDRHVDRDEPRAVAVGRVLADDEVGGQEAPRLPVPVDAGAARAGAGTERAEMTHRQRDLVHAVAERERLAHRLLEDAVAHRVAQLVLDVVDAEIGDGVAKRAALDRDDLQAVVGQLLRENASGPAEADDDDVDRRQSRRHAHPFRTPVSRPAMLTNGMSYFLPYCSISAT
jgi:MFS family permease